MDITERAEEAWIKHCLNLVRALTLAAALSVTDASGEILVAPAAKNGDDAPGTGEGVRFTQFSDPQINNFGEVLFIGRLAGAGITGANNSGIWIGTPDDLRLAVQTGDHADVEEEGASFDFFSLPILGYDTATFYARLRGPGISTDTLEPGNDDSLWSVLIFPYDSSLLSDRLPRNEDLGYDQKYLEQFRKSLARSGLPVSTKRLCFALKELEKQRHKLEKEQKDNRGFRELLRGFKDLAKTPNNFGVDVLSALLASGKVIPGGVTFPDPNRMVSPKLKDNDNAAPRVGKDDDTVSGLVFNDTVTAAEGDPAPGTGADFIDLSASEFALSHRNFVFTGATEAGVGLWRGNTGGSLPLALPGLPLPPPLGDGLDAGHSLNRIDKVGINGRGEVAFTGVAGLATFVAAGPPDAPQLVARSTSGGASGFDDFADLVMNAAGDVAFLAEHSDLGDGSQGLYITFDRSAPVRVLAEGLAADGLEPGEVISVFGDGLHMNRLGQVAVQAGFGSEAGFENTVGYGIWLVDPIKGAQLVVKQDGLIDTGDGEMRRVLGRPTFASSFAQSQSGGDDGSAGCLNDHGQLVFVASWIEDETLFTTGTGVFVARDPSAGITYEEYATRVHRLTGDDAMPLADPDTDGVTNAIECSLFGGLPDDSSQFPILPAPLLDNEGRAYIGIAKAPGLIDASFRLERRNAAGDWVSEGTTVLQDNAFEFVARLDIAYREALIRLAVTIGE